MLLTLTRIAISVRFFVVVACLLISSFFIYSQYHFLSFVSVYFVVFGLDDLTSTTTRSLDLDSLLGGPWGGGQSVSDSETDTQGLRHIKSQLEGLETMYGEVLKMLGARPNQVRNLRRRQGSLSSLPSSSVSGRPIRDRRRNDDRKKVRDIKVRVNGR
jgi:hypothetical protein